MRLIVAVLCSLLLTAFTNPKISRSLASGAIGCPPDEIGISNETDTWGVHSFTATCRGFDYFCTFNYPAPISCKARTDLTPDQLQAAHAERAQKMDAWEAGVLRKAIEHWKKPEQVESGTEAQIRVKVDGEGELLDLSWVQPTGNKTVDKSVVKAFKNAAPFDSPPDTGAAFNGIVITFPVSTGNAVQHPTQ